MSDASDAPQTDEPQKSKTPLSRIILFSILGVAIVVLLFDFYARQQVTVALDKVFKYTNEYELSLPDPLAAGDDQEEFARRADARSEVRYDRNAITITKVREMVGKTPSQKADPDNAPLEDVFVWPGFWKHSLKVRYSPASEEVGEPYIIAAERDQKFWFVQ